MILRSPFPDVPLPQVPLPDFVLGELDAASADQPAVLAAEPGGRSLTRRELHAAVRRVAAELAHRGVGPGDVVAVFAANCPDYPVVFYGALACGATVTPLNALYTAGEVAHQLRTSRAVLLFTSEAGLECARAAVAAEGVVVREIVVLETDLIELLRGTAPEPSVVMGPDDLAALPYSSGTTGLSKGVMLTHGNLTVNLLQMSFLNRLDETSRILAVVPLFHIYGLNAIMGQAVYRRARLITMPRFDLVAFLEAIQRHRVTHLYIAPPIATALARHPLVDSYDLSSLELVCSAAAPLDPALSHAVAARLKVTVLQALGMTEAAPCTHGIPVDRDDMDRGSVGVLAPNVEARIVDPATGADVTSGRPGELLVRGPNIMRGYLNDPAATAATIDPDGYLHTGDLVTVDADGIFRVVGRLKELIKYKGHQIAPAELEAVLLGHPEVADAAVVGMVADGEELPTAFVVRRPSAEVTGEQVMDFVAARVAPQKKVRAVRFVDAIPKSPAGKILRRELQTM